jgi:hypothetical protein
MSFGGICYGVVLRGQALRVSGWDCISDHDESQHRLQDKLLLEQYASNC